MNETLTATTRPSARTTVPTCASTLRPRPAPRKWSRTGPTTSSNFARRLRLPQGLRGLQGSHGAHWPADRRSRLFTPLRYALGTHFAGRNFDAYQMKKLTLETPSSCAIARRSRSRTKNSSVIPYMPPVLHAAGRSPALRYMKERRRTSAAGRSCAAPTASPSFPERPPALRRCPRVPASSRSPRTMALVRLIDLRQAGRQVISCRSFLTRPVLAPDASFLGEDLQHDRPVSTRSSTRHDAVLPQSEQGRIPHTGITEAGSAAALPGRQWRMP